MWKLAECIKKNLEKKFTLEDEHKIACFLYPPTRRLRMFSAVEGDAILDLVRCRLPAPVTPSMVPVKSSAAPVKRKPDQLDFSAFEDVEERTESGLDEIERYRNYQGRTDLDILSFWKTNEELFPGLSKSSKKYLAVPAGSTESERLFSKGGIVVDDLRTSLNADKVEDILFLYSNSDKF